MTKPDINIDELAAKRDTKGLIKALKSKDNATRYSAARAISKLGPDASEAMPALVEMLKHWDTMTRAAAAGAIGNIGINCKKEVAPAIPSLREALDDRENIVRRAAATALQDIDPEPWYHEEEEDPDIFMDSL
ncbi:MAG: HEAT repeat domain-containing protein [Dehalococcoidia bacterium]|jgi:HEAT repeat protein